MKRVLVAGATGYLGRYLVRELKARGHWVRVLIRKPEQEALFDAVDDVFVGQITDPNSLAGICEGIDWVITSVGITRQKDGMTYMDVDFQGNLNLLQQAQAEKVDRFQYISAINGDQMRHLKIFEAKEGFVDRLVSCDVSHQVIRPNGFFSDMRDFLDMAKSGRVYLFGDGEFKLNPIHGADLAAFCVDSLNRPETDLTIGGPDMFTQNELAALALEVWDKPARIIHLPDGIRKFIIWAMRTFTASKTYGPVEFFMTAMSMENIAPTTGTHHLRDYFESEVAKAQ
ncbi:SDR family oxidoreductase [Pontibacter sp. G13]|uniref:SDR family oxidoreductase n=1 Tax=Pontibacter sp. G13 TaxID=3074898 RepID=UPI0028891F7D|nr:SDR family oxidoreductase [Pontibacter sp. G13]WNJ18790.1 SDR family oxidoreductase [Pontibacter sp. G13]